MPIRKSQIQTELVECVALGATANLLTFSAPDWARGAEPGQFVHIRTGEGGAPLLRRPVSICTTDLETGTFSLLIQVVGPGTQWLATRRPGTRVDMLGPLGRSFVWRRKGAAPPSRLMLVGGGVGVAPLLFLAQTVRRACPAAPPEILFFYGARTVEQFVMLDRIEPLVDELVLATEDGSRGEKGFVTESAERRFTPETQVMTCGPNPMMNDLLARMRRAGLEGQVSLEAMMACGVGACQGCATPTRTGYARVCCEGPVFPTERFDRIES